MRIAMLCSNHPVSDTRVTHKQAASLGKLGHQVSVFAMEGTAVPNLPNVNLRVLSPFKTGIRARLIMMPKLYRAVIPFAPDVVTAHEPETAWVGLKLRNRLGSKVVFDVHEMWHETMAKRAPIFIRPFVRGMFSFLLKRIGRECDWITVVSPAAYSFYRSMRNDERVEIIHNSPRIELFPECHQDVIDPITIVYEGYLSLERGLIQMLQAAAIVRRTQSIRFLIVGRVRDSDERIFMTKIEELGLKDIVILPGWQPYEKLGEIESQAQIGMICHQKTPNTFQSLSNKLYSYMACGQAIIGPIGSATADMIEKYKVGLCVDTSKPEEIAKGIEKLSVDVQLRKQFGANGRKSIEHELGWHVMEQRLAKIYAKLEKRVAY